MLFLEKEPRENKCKKPESGVSNLVWYIGYVEKNLIITLRTKKEN